ncbi:hypothetical protein DPMN_078413 [Dreissena polymorpha]|uniref:Uncharacterized protein n=1 Tax=Dreissena polymorpha TaxID=45954 RepID=A0A9D3YMM5_DREPO|nr:hypothetical protein DPMN_078413 [Dreissena polymorpha]
MLVILTHLCLASRKQALANSVDPDETSHDDAASHQVWSRVVGGSRSTRRKPNQSCNVTTNQTHMLPGTGLNPGCLDEKRVNQTLHLPVDQTTRTRPDYPDRTRLPGQDRTTWTRPDYPDKTGLPGQDQTTRTRPDYPDKTRLPGQDQTTRTRPDYPDKTRLPGQDLTTRTRPDYPDKTRLPWTRPDYPDKTRLPGQDQTTRTRPDYPDKTRLPGQDQTTRTRPHLYDDHLPDLYAPRVWVFNLN